MSQNNKNTMQPRHSALRERKKGPVFANFRAENVQLASCLARLKKKRNQPVIPCPWHFATSWFVYKKDKTTRKSSFTADYCHESNNTAVTTHAGQSRQNIRASLQRFALASRDISYSYCSLPPLPLPPRVSCSNIQYS